MISLNPEFSSSDSDDDSNPLFFALGGFLLLLDVLAPRLDISSRVCLFPIDSTSQFLRPSFGDGQQLAPQGETLPVQLGPGTASSRMDWRCVTALYM